MRRGAGLGRLAAALLWGMAHLAFASPAERVVATAAALREGERIAYDLYYQKGFVAIPAGTAELSVTRTNGVYDLALTLAASPVVEKVYHLSTRLASRVMPDLHPIRYTKHAEEGGRVYDEVVDFRTMADGGCAVSCRRTFADGRVRTNEVCRAESVHDLLSVIFQARATDLLERAKAGRVVLPVATGLKVEDQVLVFKGDEKVRTADGKDVPSQVFGLLKQAKPGEEASELARFWLSRDARRLPLRINLNLKFGSASARLRAGTGAE